MSELIGDSGLEQRRHRLLPRQFHEALRRSYNFVMSMVPASAKYALGEARRRKRLPYRIVEDGDIVVQAGAPWDLIESGRSRAIYFARLVGRGKVVVAEPDPESCDRLRAFLAREKLEERVHIFEGALWREAGEGTFLSSPLHPAASLLVDSDDMAKIGAKEMEQRKYRQITVPLDTLDNVLERFEAGLPKLISVTTNGSELAIIDGMTAYIQRGVEFISLAETGIAPGQYLRHMEELGYTCVSRDDRGFTFRRTSN